MTDEVFRTPDERFENLPGYDFAPNYVDVDGLRMHYLDEGPRSGRPIVCFHGEPSWAYLYRKMIGPLVEAGNRVVVPDYAGFGRSDKPTDRRLVHLRPPHRADVAVCSPASICSDAIVVVQDWGGAIGLRWAVENADRVGALAIFNTGSVHRPGLQGFHRVAGLRREEPGSAGRLRDPGRDGDRAARRCGRRLRRAVPECRVEGRRGAVPAAGADHRGCARRTRDARGRRRAVAVAEAGAGRVLRSGSDLPVSESGTGVLRSDSDRDASR